MGIVQYSLVLGNFKVKMLLTLNVEFSAGSTHVLISLHFPIHWNYSSTPQYMRSERQRRRIKEVNEVQSGTVSSLAVVSVGEEAAQTSGTATSWALSLPPAGLSSLGQCRSIRLDP